MKSFRFLGLLGATVVILSAALHAAGGDPLVKRLVATDNREREAAQRELSDMPADQQKRVVSGLIPLLKGTETDQREHAAEALQKLGPAAEAAIPALQHNLSDDFPYVRIHSAEALARIGPAAMPAFIEALKNDNNEVRLVAVQALAHLGPAAKPAIPSLIQSLQDKESPMRRQAAGALENCGAEASPALINALEDPAFKNRAAVVRVLGAIDGTPPHLPSQLTPFLSDPDAELRLATIKALTRKGPSAVPAVSLALSSENALVRSESADILADIGPEAASAVSLLTGLLKDPEARVRAASAHALGKMNGAAAPAIPALREATKDADRDVAARAQDALEAITVVAGGSHEIKTGSVPLAEKASTSPSQKSKPASKAKPNPMPRPLKKPHIAYKASEARLPLSYLKLDSTASLRALELTAQKGNSEARAPALAALASLLQNPDEKIRAEAAAALERMGTEEARKILDPYRKQEELKKINRLMAEIRTSTGSVKDAVDALARMGPVVVPAVTRGLKDPKAGVRLAAAQIFTRLGPASASAVPQLLEALDDKAESVRHEAAKALEAIDSPQAKNPLRWHYLKEKLRPLLKALHLDF
jgi:HEAT repeat protein